MVLWCVVSVLAVLAISGLFRSMAASNLRWTSHDLVVEWKFETLARSLIAALEAELRRAVNTEGPISDLLRHSLSKPDSTWVDLTPFLDASLCQTTLAREEYAGFVLEKLEVGIAFQTPLPRSFEEKVAVAVFRAQLKLPATARQVSRRLELARSIKVSRTTIDPVLDRYGLFIGSATGLTDLPQANAIYSDLVSRLTPLYPAMVAQRDASSGSVRQSWEWVLDQTMDPSATGALPNKLPEPARFAFYGLIPSAATQDLGPLDLAVYLQGIRAQVDQLQAYWESVKSDSSKASKAAGALAAAMQDGIWRLWAYQKAYKILPLDGSPEAARAMELSALLEAGYFAPRAQWVLREDPEGPTVEDQLYGLLSLVGVASGVVSLENRKVPVVLRGQMPGNLLLLAGPGGVVLNGVNSQPRPGDHLTVSAHAGPVRIQGRCNLTLALGRPGPGEPALTLEFAQGSQLVGALLMVQRPDPWPDRGSVTHRAPSPLLPLLTGGVARSAGLFVAVSPRILYQRVERL